MTDKRQIILSGMRPTGRLHLGHLLGALNNWVRLQEEYECYFMVADWHALMSEYEKPGQISQNIYEMAADWTACGLDPKESTIFVQSEVKEHLELAMILSDITPLPWLERCPTYKEMLRQETGRNLATYGFLGYPVLQAADILLYRADNVPVGQDQLAHLELTREIARRFNNLYKETFKEPKALLTETPKLLGLDNRKMSKSFGNTIELADKPEVIRRKVGSMITDPARIKKTDPGHPEICNVFSYYKAFKPEIVTALERDCKGAVIGCTDDKARLAEVLIEFLRPIRQKREGLLKDKKDLERMLQRGAEKARQEAGQTMKLLRRAMGIA